LGLCVCFVVAVVFVLNGNFFVLFVYHPGTVSRKIFNTREPVDSIPYDHDENKYQRRGAIDWFTRWFW